MMINDVFPEKIAPLISDFQCVSCLREDVISSFLAMDMTGRKVLVKVSDDPAGMERLRNEYQQLKRLAGEHGIPSGLFSAPVDLRERGDLTVMIREYIPGHSLETLVEGSASPGLPEKEAIRLVTSLLEQLQLLHHMDPPVIHRDIKPQNLIVDAAGQIHLIDFDIARAQRTEAAVDTVVMGTRLTSAPEQFGYRSTDARSDLYSVGIVLRYCLTGVYDDRADSALSHPMQKIVRKAAAFDPDRRYQSAEAFLQALKTRSLRKQSNLRPWRILGATAALMVLIFGLAMIFHFSPGGEGASGPVAAQSAAEDTAAEEEIRAETASFPVPEEITEAMFGGDAELYEMFQRKDYRENTVVISPEGMRFVRYLEYDAENDPAPMAALSAADFSACLDLLQRDAGIWKRMGNILLVNLDIESFAPLEREWGCDYICLELHRCVLPEDCAPLRALLPHLIELTGSSSFPPAPLDWLKAENHLQILTLKLEERGTLDLSPLAGLKDLTMLTLWNWELDEASLEVIRSLPSLTDLYFFECNIVDESELTGFEHLKNIFIY